MASVGHGRGGEHRPAIARADIDRQPRVAADDPRDLADVHLDEAASDGGDHGRRIAPAANVDALTRNALNAHAIDRRQSGQPPFLP
jgi:hypothetical protein